MLSTNDFKNGVTLEYEGEVYPIIEFQHVKPGKGAAFVRCKLRNMQNGAVIEKTFNPGDKFPKGRVDKREYQYLYNDDADYHFMDMETYDQSIMSVEQLGDAVRYLKENMIIHVMIFHGKPIGLDLPNTVELEVIETSPGIKGDTASGGSKPATLETGYIIQVPFFINTGDILQIDTRTGQYLKRA
ncbi:MAG: elongation factor P [Peptococcaceae bacterium]|nr:elongation factor P [Peptococcaceae bacterium]